MTPSALASKTTKMDKRRIKITATVLDEVKAQFPETKKSINELLEQECSNQNIPVKEVVFLFTYLEAES